MKATEIIKEIQNIIDKEQKDFDIEIYDYPSGDYIEIDEIQKLNNKIILY